MLNFHILKESIAFYNVPENVENAHFPDEGHGYEYSKRQPVYAFLAKQLDLTLENIQDNNLSISEENITIEEYEQMKIFSETNPLPAHAIKSNDQVVWE